ncbi:MAG: DUF4249 domain-containing protein [Bacteroidia bacterium]|nr:DUF4249 domain-containing protein [Bacteroidia bacterium]MDW8089075.1 DUF4249 family protein [Bacteroidia bacterium]
MQRQKYAIGLIFLGVGCRTEVDLIAPQAREQLVVYGILYPDRDTQYIRVGRLFVTREDAMAYAARTDLSVQAEVRVSDGNTTWLAQPETVVKIPHQPFYPVQVVYRLLMRPRPRQRYFLHINVPENPSLNVSATALVPAPPYIARPETVALFQGQPTYPIIDLMRPYDIQYFARVGSAPAAAAGYEIRFTFRYGALQGPDTLWRTLSIGPYLVPAKAENAQVFTLREKQLLRTVYSNLYPFSQPYVYDESPFSQAWSLTVTALDTPLYNYLRINSPGTTDFTTVKPEYTNIRNGLGIFGAVATSRRFFRIDDCSRYLLRLNNAPPPPYPCKLED